MRKNNFSDKLIILHLKQQIANLLYNNKKLVQSELNTRRELNIKSKILSIISHDITPILLYIAESARRLKHEAQDANSFFQEELEDISYTANELISNINIFLIWNEFKQPDFEMITAFHPIFSLVNSVINVYKGEANKKRLRLSNNTDEELLIKIDPVLFRILFSNLVSNALKHTTVGVITINSSVQSSGLVISIHDSGEGMTEGQVNTLYKTLNHNDQFVSGDDSFNLKGLGYQIIAEMISMASGEVRIESTPGKGTSVFVSFAQ